MAPSISESSTYSSAVWLRQDSPGPIFSDGKPCISDMSLVVGDTKESMPSLSQTCTSGCSRPITEARTRVERSVSVVWLLTALRSNAMVSSLE